MSTVPRILLLGAGGQLGAELKRSFFSLGKLTAFDRETVDISDARQLRNFVQNLNPEIILNAAAYTAVDRAESEPELVMAVNGVAPSVLAEEAIRLGALLVHYSTDYVFDGAKKGPWTEADEPNPLNVYGRSKLAGERAIQQVGGSYLIFRTSWVYGPHGSNFLLTMLRLAGQGSRIQVVDDQHGAPTSTLELASATQAIVAGILDGRFGSPSNWAGLYHMSCSGQTTWHGFAQAIFARAAKQLEAPDLHAIASRDYTAAARRPANSVLSNERLNTRFGIRLAAWEPALSAVMEALSTDS